MVADAQFLPVPDFNLLQFNNFGNFANKEREDNVIVVPHVHAQQYHNAVLTTIDTTKLKEFCANHIYKMYVRGEIIEECETKVLGPKDEQGVRRVDLRARPHVRGLQGRRYKSCSRPRDETYICLPTRPWDVNCGSIDSVNVAGL